MLTIINGRSPVPPIGTPPPVLLYPIYARQDRALRLCYVVLLQTLVKKSHGGTDLENKKCLLQKGNGKISGRNSSH